MTNTKTVGSFIVEDSIGGGGMGELLLGYQPALDRPVVLKTLRRDLASRREYVKRFHREACLAASVHHQNVVAVYDCFVHRGHHYIALEHVDGLDLRTVLQRAGALPPRICALIALECARGIEAIHARGMVHRDIKPANILVGRQGETKIADFGIALDPSATPLTRTGFAMGSPPYMPPEQFQGDRVDARADIFALGAVLYELLAGRPPYETSDEQNDETLLDRMIRERYVPLRKTAPDAPRFLRGLVRDCLRNKTRRRLGSAMELRKRLERQLGRPTTAEAREEIATCLWDLGLFQIREGETVIARVAGRRRGRPARVRWIAAGLSIVALLGILSTVMLQQQVILRELASLLPQISAPPEFIEAIENARAHMRNDQPNGLEALPPSEDTAPPADSSSVTDGPTGHESNSSSADSSRSTSVNAERKPLTQLERARNRTLNPDP